MTELPNIGPVLADNLQKIGIESGEELRNVGTEDAWMRIRLQVDPGACLHQLQALAGAVEGVPKKDLPAQRKAELKRFFDSHK